MHSIDHFMLDNVRCDCVCVCFQCDVICVCVCVCSMCLCGQTESFSTSWDQVHRTWEQNRHSQVITCKCTGLCTVVKQVVFEEGLTFTGLKSCIYREIIAVFLIYKQIHCCSYYKIQAHCSIYAVAQVNGLKVFIRINDSI